MPVYLFTYHTYRSWMPDHERGFTQEDKGYQLPNEDLADAYRDAAAFPPYELDASAERFLIETAHEICGRRGWRLYAGASEPTHLHTLVGWHDEATTWEFVRGKLKNILSLELSKRANTFGRPWFCDKASRRRVLNPGHFDYLVDVYLLTKYFGWRWSERHGWHAPGALQ